MEPTLLKSLKELQNFLKPLNLNLKKTLWKTGIIQYVCQKLIYSEDMEKMVKMAPKTNSSERITSLLHFQIIWNFKCRIFMKRSEFEQKRIIFKSCSFSFSWITKSNFTILTFRVGNEVVGNATAQSSKIQEKLVSSIIMHMGTFSFEYS